MDKIRSPKFAHTLIMAFICVIFIVTNGAGLRAVSAAPQEPVATPTSTDSLTVVSVVKGKSVTIGITNMPSNKEFRVLMNLNGTQGLDGTNVGTAKTDKNGSFTGTFLIPANLKDRSILAIRIEATDNSGYYAYTWFRNGTSGSATTQTPNTSGTAGNLNVESVVEDTNVTIAGISLPPSQGFIIWFDWKNPRNVVNTLTIGTIRSDKDGKINATIKIPSELKDRIELAIRLQSTDGKNVYTTGWFLNATSDKNVGSNYPAGYTEAIPYITILSTVEDKSVTIRVYHLPAKIEFYAFMGKMGSKGVKGTKVGSFKTGTSESVTVKFEIPEKLQGNSEIAIRVESRDGSGYYIYSWFDNSTKP